MADNHGQGDSTAKGDGYVEPCGASYGWGTWKNQLLSEEAQRTRTSRSQWECVDIVDLHYDEFDDESIDPLWDSQTLFDGTFTEENNRLNFNLDPYPGSGGNIRIRQTSVKGIDNIRGFNHGFDIYYKVRIPDLADMKSDHSGSTMLIRSQFIFTGGVGLDQVGLLHQWNGSAYSIHLETDGGSNQMDGSLTSNVIWGRLRFLPGVDTETKFWYAQSDPLVGGWTGPYVNSKRDPDPTGHTNLEFALWAYNFDVGDAMSGWWVEFIKPWTGG